MKGEATEAMVVVMEERATETQIEQVVARLVEMGMDVHRSTGITRTVLGAVGQGHVDKGLIEMLEGVPVYQPDREKEVIEHVRSIAVEGPLGPDAIVRLFERIIDEARRLERRLVHGEETSERST